MTGDMNASKIYKRLAGGQKRPISHLIGYILLGVFAYIAIAWYLLSFIVNGVMGMDIAPKFVRTDLSVAAIAALLITLAPAVVYIKFAVKRIKQAERKIEKRQELLNAISEVEFYKLDSQLTESEFYFKTFYFLEDYLYVPREKLLIKYTDIENYTTKTAYPFGSVEPSGVYVHLADNDGLKYKIKITQWRKYLKHKKSCYNDTFELRIREKIAEKAGVE